MPFYEVPGEKICEAYHSHRKLEREADADGNHLLAQQQSGICAGFHELGNILFGSVYVGSLIMDSDTRFDMEAE